jgi:hypothetical protein
MRRINFRNTLVSAFMLIIAWFGSNFASGQQVVRQGPAVPVNFCIHASEMELYRMINEYRKHENLPPIPLSKSLSYVASLHAKDLFFNHPDNGPCNFHSWSNKGSWTQFCYPKDESKKNSVWDKPRELTKYPSKAYEIVYWENNPLVTDTIMMVWKTEDYFNSFLLNSGKWLGKSWRAIGIAVYENYACAWFGEVPDPEGEAFVCGTKTRPSTKKADSLAVKHADTLPEKSPDPLAVKQEPSFSPRDSTSGTYYIIVKTNLPMESANKMVKTMRAGQYPDAKVLETNGKIRVSAFESPDKAVVMIKLKDVKKIYKDAWLLKR